MNPKQFKYVLTLAEEGSFSKAAEKLNIRQPSLSQFIKNIENEAGTELFDRSGGDVRLTDAGKAYIEIGRRVADLEHQLEGRLSDLASYKTGSVSVGISAHRSVALMPPVASAFMKAYPGMTLHIVERSRRQLLEAAGHGEFDLVITTLPIDEELFDRETVFIEENIVAAPGNVSLPSEKDDGRKYPVISASSLNGLPFAMLNDDHLMQRELSALIRRFDLDLIKKVECTSLEALVSMVKAGIGAAFIPECLATAEGINYYSIKETVPEREIVVMYRKDQYLSGPVRDLKKIIHETLK